MKASIKNVVPLAFLATVALAGTENTLNYANSYCGAGNHEEWLCAEFVARSLMAGGEFADCTTA